MGIHEPWGQDVLGSCRKAATHPVRREILKTLKKGPRSSVDRRMS